jgi:hypothetical protein
MKKIGRALKAGVSGFVSALGPGQFAAGGKQVQCTHCDGDLFTQREALLNTTGATLVNSDWLSKSGTALICENCGLIQWYGKRPDKL